MAWPRTSVECKCNDNFTCGFCLSNMKPWIWTSKTETWEEYYERKKKEEEQKNK